MRSSALIVILLILAGCSSSPKVASDVDRSLTPKVAATSPGEARQVQWGGVIIQGKNLSDVTELEIIAYPLQSDGEPNAKASPEGRFIARKSGYLETVDYARGRRVTVSGNFSEVRSGQVGNSAYDFPIVQADEIVLWPTERDENVKPRVNFGFGIGSGGRSWGGVGIGIGF
jgi:outer membrane lipoprotein